MPAPLSTSSRTGHFEVTSRRQDGIVSVTVRGTVEFDSAREAKTLLLTLLDSEPRGLLVDVREAFVDSSGIAVLVHVAQRAHQERRLFRLLCHDQLGQLLRSHGLANLLGLTDTTAATTPSRSHSRAA
jgi:anti-anti-sigma factor